MTAQPTAKGVAAELRPETHAVLGREVRLPVVVRDATAATAYYMVSASAADALIAESGLRVARPLPGRTPCTISTMNYKEGDLGAYHEIAITFFVQEPGARSVPFVGAMLGLARGSMSAYIHRLPVDGEFTCEAGRSVWGFPKFVTEIVISTEGDTETAVLSENGEHILTQRMRTGGSRSFSRRQASFAYLNGTLTKTPSEMGGEDVRISLGGEPLELGTHAVAQELATLGLPHRPLFTTYIGMMTGTFYAAERIEKGT